MGGVAWTEEEDHLLRKCIEQYGEGKWHRVPLLAGLNRCRKSCRLRWLNYLRPNIKRGSFAEEEVDLIIKLHKLLGNRWSLIAGRLPGRTANDVKNYWNCHLSKRLSSQDLDQPPQDTKLQIGATAAASPGSPGAAVEIIRPHPRNIAARPPNYGLQEEQGSTSTAPPPPPMLFVEDTGGESSSWVIHSSKGKELGSCYNQGMEDGGMLTGGAVAGEEMIGMDFRFEQVQVRCGDDESCSSKWDWDDLICDMDLWGESL